MDKLCEGTLLTKKVDRLELKVRDTGGRSGTRKTPQAIFAEEAYRPPRRKRASERKSTFAHSVLKQ